MLRMVDLLPPVKKRPKYKAQPTVVGDIKFASKAEAKRYGELRQLLRAGAIAELELQPVFQLAPSVMLDGRKKPALRYVADFAYVDAATGRRVVEDVKGMATPAYRIKRHLMKTYLGIEVVEIKR